MKIRLISTVKSPFYKVYEKFDQQLFKFLLPPFSIATIERYEGQSAGDIVDIRFRIPLLGHWVVIIKESWLSHREYGFTDRGLLVPFGIKYWQHMHRIVARTPDSVFIIDDIEFETSWKILDYLLYIPLYIMFFPRIYQYEKYYKSIR